MSLQFDEIANFTSEEGRKVKASRRPIDQGGGLTRRSLVQRGAALGTVLGLSTLGVLPPAKRAEAACTTTSEKTIYSSCPTTSEGFGCDPACGPSMVYGDTCNSNGWHKTSGNFRMRPNECRTGGYDGWFWRRQCGCPSTCTRSFRCHDGCRLTNGVWKNSVCRLTSACICP
jgi:hypothetical protein